MLILFMYGICAIVVMQGVNLFYRLMVDLMPTARWRGWATLIAFAGVAFAFCAAITIAWQFTSQSYAWADTMQRLQR